MANGLLQFIAGLGTGYMTGDKDRLDRERQAKLDQMNKESHDLTMKTQQAQLDEMNRKNENRKAVEAGLTIANSMKPGDLQDQEGNKYGTSTEDFTNRLVQGGINPEIAKGAAELYSKSAQQPGAEKWLSNTDFSDNATTRSAQAASSGAEGASGMPQIDGQVSDGQSPQLPQSQATGPLKGITQSDIDQKRADAYATGGIDYDEQRMKALHDSAKAKYGEGIRLLQKFDGTNFDDTVKKAYDNFDDGHDIHSEVGADGKFYTYYTDPNGNKVGMKSWDSPDAFKYDAMMHLVDPNNADKYIENMMRFEGEKQKATSEAKKLDQQERIAGMKEDRKDARDEARFAEQEKLQQRSFANMMAMLDKRLAKEGNKGAKGLSDSDQQEDANIVSARNKIHILSSQGGLKAIQDKLTPTIMDKDGITQIRNPNYDPVIAEQYKAANKPRPAMVRIYGLDPMLDRFNRGLQPYQYTPLPPPDLRKVGETYEMPDGTAVKWDGKGIVKAK